MLVRAGVVRLMAVPYVELHCHSVFSLLDGASEPEALVTRAHALGHPALALTDHDDLGGAVRFAAAAAEAGIDGIIGGEITLTVPSARHASGEMRTHLVVLAEDREGYGNLSSLITRARMDTPRGEPGVSLDTLARHARGLYALSGCPRGWVPRLVRAGDADAACEAAATLLDIFDGRLAIEVWDHHLPEERSLVHGLLPIARALGIPWVVTNDVHYAEPRGRIVHDVLSAIRHKRTLDEMGTRLRPSGEWYLKSGAQMRRRWQHDDAGIRATVAIAERCAFRLASLKPTLPAFPLPPGVEPDEYLSRLVAQGARERWGVELEEESGTPASGSTVSGRGSGGGGGGASPPPKSTDTLADRRQRQLRHELALIRRLGLAGYFLIVWDLVRFARRDGVLCQGRGSAANSAVCYCLGITAVDPVKLELLFERFLSEERREPPDIDIDFAHRDRERVLQYVYQRYGREHAAMVCEHITYRGKSAVRDTARVLGFSVQQADALSAFSDRFSARATAEGLRTQPPQRSAARGDAVVAERLGQRMIAGTEATTRARAVKDRTERRNPVTATRPAADDDDDTPSILERAGLDPRDPRVRVLADVVDGLHQAPRHRSIHVGGFVLTAEPLRTVVPIEPASMPDRTVIQWERDDLDPVGLVKIDLLGLGMLTVLQDCLKYIRATRGVTIDLGQLDMTDQAVYDDICAADTIGVFQVESRAQMNTLPRLKPRSFYDLVVEVALIRPGPIQGEMVHPYLRRRAGEEAVTYPHPSLEPVLRRTLGIPLFQEQGMQVAVTAAGFTPGEADVLRKAMGHKRSHERMAAICEKLIRGMQAHGIAEDVARRIYNQINAFADYGFPESHAASFALIVYASAYLRHYFAPEFTAAMLNAQPMGFYSVGTLVEDAKRHGVEVRPVDLTRSAWDHTLEVDGVLTVVPWDGVISVLGARGAPPEQHDATPSPTTHHQSTAPRTARPPAPAIRLGLRSIRGFGAAARERLEAALRDGPFADIPDVVHRAGLDQRALRFLAESGAFDTMVPDVEPARRRRVALWRVLEALRGDAGPLAPLLPATRAAPVPAMQTMEITEADYRLTSLSLNGHPMRHLRPLLDRDIRRAVDLQRNGRDGQKIAVAGLVICRQRPGTAKGFVFLSLEDETGIVNVVVTPKRFERQALLITDSPLLLVRGTLQVEQR
ncbi:MAG TPA: DNA polymerase III subunit alpha, partial [Gemmatimonadaceae bacterium]|nr:DNA polymerase III subunit alpha [Gemmatimonadaceae bacterium]